MLLRTSHILEVYEYKNHIILCRIHVKPRHIIYHKHSMPVQTHRWMQTEDWVKFDMTLKSLVDKCMSSEESKIEQTFQLNGLISVFVKNSQISTEALFLCTANEKLNTKNVVLPLDCVIEYCDDDKRNFSKFNDDVHNSGIDNSGEIIIKVDDQHEYEPQLTNTSNGSGTSVEASTGYVPYTPSPKEESKSRTKNIVTHEEDEYLPLPVGSTSTELEEKSAVPKYSPGRIRKRMDESVHQKRSTRETELLKKIEREDTITTVPQKKRRECRKDSQHKSNKESSTEVQSHNESLESPNVLPISKDDENLSDNGERKSKNAPTVTIEPRRSQRPPVKPVRLIEEDFEEILIRTTPQRKHSLSPPSSHHRLCKTKRVHTNLFGSDDDDDGDGSAHNNDKNVPKHHHQTALKTPVNRKNLSLQTPNGKRIKKDCEHEKQVMTTWLGKKQHEESKIPDSKNKKTKSHDRAINKKKHRPAANDTCNSDDILHLSKEQLEVRMKEEKAQIEHNRQLKKILEEWAGPPPTEVDTLSLHDLSSKQILDSFAQHKPLLDDIFQKSNRKMYVRGHDGIDHYLVIGLIDHSKQLDMMNKLSDVYENNSEGSSTYATLFANAMMPEWIIAIFMKKFNFTRAEAIQQVKAQEEYKLHLEAQADSSFPAT